jgi:hypothetical protein
MFSSSSNRLGLFELVLFLFEISSSVSSIETINLSTLEMEVSIILDNKIEIRSNDIIAILFMLQIYNTKSSKKSKCLFKTIKKMLNIFFNYSIINFLATLTLLSILIETK